jgi:hypothetical protein
MQHFDTHSPAKIIITFSIRKHRIVTISIKTFSIITHSHRYLKKSRLLKFCYVPATSAASSKGIFAAATNSINQTNKAVSTCH